MGMKYRRQPAPQTTTMVVVMTMRTLVIVIVRILMIVVVRTLVAMAMTVRTFMVVLVLGSGMLRLSMIRMLVFHGYPHYGKRASAGLSSATLPGETGTF